MDLAELLIREQVRHTIAWYNTAGDGGDLESLAGCFAPDGTLEIKGRPPLVGREGIRDGLASLLQGPDDRARPAVQHVRHSVTTLHFASVTAEEVRTTSYFTVLTQIGLDHWGRYRDRLVPVDGRWLFARREVKTDAYGAGSLFEQR